MKVLEINSATETHSITKQKPKTDSASSPIRVRQSSRVKLDDLLRRANKQKLGRKVKSDDLSCFSLGLLTDEHLEQICSKTLTKGDRLELLFSSRCEGEKGSHSRRVFWAPYRREVDVVDIERQLR